MFTHAYMLLAAAQGHALSLHSILTDIPHDVTAFIVYALTGASIWFVVHYGRKSGAETGKDQDERNS